ncbi:hypothetical protein LTR65_009866 [Meristemomyces frigidus]
MADPLSIAASVAGLVSLGLQATGTLYDFYTAYKDRNDDLARTATRLGSLVEVLRLIQVATSTREWRADERSIVQTIEAAVSRSTNGIEELAEEVQKFKKVPAKTLTETIATVGRRVAYPFRKRTLVKLEELVGESNQDLSVALQVLQLKNNQIVQSEIEVMKRIVIASDLHNWLSAPDATIDYNTASAKRHPGTGRWLIQSPPFSAWLQQDSSFLWIHGFAGCGKSVLCSTAIDQAWRRSNQIPGSAVACFFFTFTDASKQNDSAMLRALLLQLSEQIVGVEDDLKQLKKTLRNASAPVSTLIEYIQQAVTRVAPDGHVYLLLDALDECPAGGQRSGVLSAIDTLRRRCLPNLHILVTSRDLPDIRRRLNASDEAMLGVTNDVIHDDIAHFVSDQLDIDPELEDWSAAERNTIKDRLASMADGS